MSSPKKNVKFAEHINVYVYEMDGGKDPSKLSYNPLDYI